MRKNVMFLGNVSIVLLILGLTIFYMGGEHRKLVRTQTEAFNNMTQAMESVTVNYLLGEQHICKSWATYINSSDMTIDAAIDYVRSSIFSSDITAHILLIEEKELSGLSTAPRAGKPDDYSVSYDNVTASRSSLETLLSKNNPLHVTRAYTNPVNAIQSVAFCCPVTLRSKDTGTPVSAALLRVVPVSSFESKWVFPTDEYKNAEISLINTSGDYIVKGRSFKNTNFYEFYKSYNVYTPDVLEGIKADMEGDPGVMEMTDSTGKRCLIAHTKIRQADDWIIVTMLPVSDLDHALIDWTTVGIITAGLLALLAFNIVAMMTFNRKLKVAVASADSANRAKTEFLSMMSHDIRTPMNAIIGLTTIAGKNIDDTPAVRENLRKIGLASNHLLSLINDILDISKVESGKLNLSPVNFSIAESAENLVNISMPMVKAKNIDFSFHVNRFDHEFLFADKLRLNQVYINLLSNAIKYTEDGGKVSVKMLEEPGALERSVKLTYIVADTGMGMTPEFMARMYQPFSRQTDSRVHTIQGTGLGLAITKQMVDLMHGTIDCASEFGKGTTFTVTLDIPIADRQEEELSLPSMRVLLADEDEILLETTKDMLHSLGACADVAKSSVEVMDMMAKTDYKAVILGQKLTDTDGVKTTEQICSKNLSDKTSVLISAYDATDIEDAAKAAGVKGFIGKPMFRSTLYNKLNELLGNDSISNSQEDDYSDIEGTHILVAEDNDINWEIISMLLSMQGIEAERAENGQIALQRIAGAKEGEFDLIFMDVQMPVMNGLEATAAIRSLGEPWASSIPIIAMTADAFSENVSDCLAAGMNGHIAKPVDMKLVLKEIKRIKEETKV